VLVEGPDCPLWVSITGRGEPVTVLAHGLAASSVDIAPMASELPGTRVLFDFRGHGRSGSPPAENGYDLAAMRRDFEAVADRTEATRAVGVSMGAAVLLSLLEEQPDRFERVALVLPAAVDRPMPGAGWYSYLAGRIASEPLERIADDSVATDDVRRMTERAPAWHDRLHGLVMRMSNPGLPHALHAVPNGPAPVRDPSSLARVTAPVLVVGHEGDAIHEAATARAVASLFPNATVEIAPEPLVMLDDMDAFSRRLAEFLSTPAPATRP